ncbi:hypothetical protein [Neochlamydia sp. AcF95]|uniref:hypothetical protein n=1 Tax=Neochlamydia sp. AcF95 TaxID=2795734 RepID=UPI001BC990CD|nr:hypothetical protein [Neochlamydia sp. AcF95]MBS4170106.1 Uncharacterized protein [Neochlamydia sp. AcF95]
MQPPLIRSQQALKSSSLPAPPVPLADEPQVSRTAKHNSIISSNSIERIEPSDRALVINRVEVLNEEEPFKAESAVIIAKVEQELENIETLLLLEAEPITTLAEQKNVYALDNFIKKTEKRKKIERHLGNAYKATQWAPDKLHKLALEPYGYIAPVISIPPKLGEIVGNVILPVSIIRTVLRGVEIIGKGAVLIVQGVQYQQAKKLLKQKVKEFKHHPQDENLKDSIRILREFISAQKLELKNKIINFTISASFIAAKSTSLVLSALKLAVPAGKTALGWTLSFLDIIMKTIGVWQAQKARSTHEIWMLELTKDPRSFQQAQDLLAKREERLLLRRFQAFSFEEIKDNLEEKGMECEAQGIIDKETFEKKITEPAFRTFLLQNFIEDIDQTEDTLNVMTRNSLQTLAELKARNEKKFFNFRLVSANIELILACLSTTLAITLQVLALTGVIALASSSMALPGLGFFVLGIAVMGIGLYFFYRYKPHLLKCVLQGVEVRLSLFQLPAKIRAWQLNKQEERIGTLKITSARYEQLAGLLEQQKTLEATAYPIELRKTLEKLHKETKKKIDELESHGEQTQLEKMMEELDRKHERHLKMLEKESQKQERLSQKVESWIGKKGKITQLQNRLKEAGSADFAIANGLITQAEKKAMNLPLIIMEKFLDPHSSFEFDEETQKILKEKMGIDYQALKKTADQVDKNALMDKLKDFFKMDDTELLALMKQQLNNLKAKKYN